MAHLAAHLVAHHDASHHLNTALAAAAHRGACEGLGFGDWAQSSQELRQGAFVSELEDALVEFDACWLN